MSKCTIVVPCYNEAQRLGLSAFLKHAIESGDSFLFVNGGSTDATGALLDEFADVSPESFRVLHLGANRGKAEAVRQGVLQALELRPKYVGYWDADLATPLAAIDEFRTYLDQHPRVEALLGARVRLLGRTIERRILRHCLGRLFATAAAAVLKLPVYDTQCGAKLFRATGRVRGIFAESFRTSWIFDVELLARLLATIDGDSPVAAEELIHELPLREWRDVAGSKVKARDFVRAAWQLASIWRHYAPPGQRRRIECDSAVAATATPSAAMPREHQPTRELAESSR
jgi:dolichyl-phosphate beta-glucosyltransferase